MRTDIVIQLDQLLQQRGTEVSEWFVLQHRTAAPVFYSSVDLRHSGFKIVPVDTNLFPAGFNNLSDRARQRAVVSFRRWMTEHYPQAKRLLIVPEDHTRNLGYLENLRVLESLLAETGLEVRIGRLSLEGDQPEVLETMLGGRITQYPLVKQEWVLQTLDGYVADLLIINNDLTVGVPPQLEGLSQPMVPPPGVGWHRRRKHLHFCAYDSVTREFAQQFGIDPWLIWTHFAHCEAVDFKQQQGLEQVMKAVDRVLEQTRAKYREYGIDEEPYAFIKADSGTYGMGIMTVQSSEELKELNKKDRNKMHSIKQGTALTEVLIQEGVPTIDAIGSIPAEPMLYLVAGQPVGGAYRINPERDNRSNLNAKGMEFTGMCDSGELRQDGQVAVENCNFQVYGLIARLASLAAAREK